MVGDLTKKHQCVGFYKPQTFHGAVKDKFQDLNELLRFQIVQLADGTNVKRAIYFFRDNNTVMTYSLANSEELVVIDYGGKRAEETKDLVLGLGKIYDKQKKDLDGQRKALDESIQTLENSFKRLEKGIIGRS